jgi:hypothetical protein
MRRYNLFASFFEALNKPVDYMLWYLIPNLLYSPSKAIHGCRLLRHTPQGAFYHIPTRIDGVEIGRIPRMRHIDNPGFRSFCLQSLDFMNGSSIFDYKRLPPILLRPCYSFGQKPFQNLS